MPNMTQASRAQIDARYPQRRPLTAETVAEIERQLEAVHRDNTARQAA